MKKGLLLRYKYFASIPFFLFFTLIDGCAGELKESDKELVSKPDLMKLCESTGGRWIERGTYEECSGLGERECGKNPNCMSFSVPVGGILPLFTFSECKPLASCVCPNDRPFYPQEGC